MNYILIYLCFYVVVIADMSVCLDDVNKRHESDIAAKFKTVFMTLGRLGKFIANGVTLLFLRQQNSMTALFMCEHRAGLKNLVDLYAFGKLQSVLEEFFTSLLVPDDPQVTMNIKSFVWELSDYCRCSLYFSPLPKRELFTSDHIV